MIINPYRLTTYRAAVLADNPVAYWRLGEAGGTTAADETGSYDGTYVNSPTLGVAGAVAGDTAVDFNGSTQYVSRAGVGDFSAENALTVEGWIKTTSGANESIVTKATGADVGQWYLYTDSFGRPIFRVCNGTIRTGKLGTTSTDDGAWHHVVFTWDAGTFAGYVDGVADTLLDNGSTGTITTLLASAVDVNIARRGTAFYCGGSLDEVAIYNSVLSPTRIAAHYDARTRA